MKRVFIIIFFLCLSVALFQVNAEAVVGIPDVTYAATLIVPLMEKGTSSAHNTLTVVTDLCGSDRIIHWQLWDIDGNAMAGLYGNVTLSLDHSWVSDFGTILAGASPSQLTQLTDGSFYRGFMTIDLVTAPTNLLPTEVGYPFSSYNCLTGQIYYVRLLEGAANGIPMVHIEGGVDSSLAFGAAAGFYQDGDDREEIDADARYYAFTSSRGKSFPVTGDPNSMIDYIYSRVYCQGNGESRIVVWTWAPAAYGPTFTPWDTPSLPFPFIIKSEAGVITTETDVYLNHIVNVIDVPGETNGMAQIVSIPSNFETYAFSFNSANYTANPAMTWEAMFESTIISDWCPGCK